MSKCRARAKDSKRLEEKCHDPCRQHERRCVGDFVEHRSHHPPRQNHDTSLNRRSYAVRIIPELSFVARRRMTFLCWSCVSSSSCYFWVFCPICNYYSLSTIVVVSSVAAVEVVVADHYHVILLLGVALC